ncbi:MAG: diguanylate cyclase, partial [Lachnospiraceae bacterium]|nr:diguanylate cyclase [Lachnospiraceae bacterium]
VVFKNGAVALDSAVHLMNIIRAKEFILNGHEVHVTTSAGLVVSSESDEFKSFDKLMLKADDRLYRAKEEGRDRLVFKD